MNLGEKTNDYSSSSELVIDTSSSSSSSSSWSDNLQIPAPPMHRRLSPGLSPGIQSDDSFTTYLYSPES